MSLPSRERGLKLSTTVTEIDFKMSLPSRERGLKFESGNLYRLYLSRSLRGSVD